MAGRTEWEDIQIKLGNMQAPDIAKPITSKEYDVIASQNREQKEVKDFERRLEEEDDQLLDELEDDKFMEAYRQKRLQELTEQAMQARFGELTEINETEYKKEVTEAQEPFVIVFLYKPSVPHCQLLEQHLRKLVTKCKSSKFVKIRSEAAIPNYPDRNLPTLLIYSKGDIVQQFIGLGQFGGEKMTTEDLEWALAEVGAVETTLENHPRAGKSPFNIIRGSSRKQKGDSDDDSDEDD